MRAVERYHGPWNRKFANKVLVIGNKGDPITPLASAKKLIQLFGPKNAVLLERDGYGVSSLSLLSAALADASLSRTVYVDTDITCPFYVSIHPLQRNLSVPITSLTNT